MSRDAGVTLTWGDGEYRFRLAIGQLRELQEKTDAGPLELFRRMEAGTWRIDDLIHTIRLGLIGGGMEPVPALRLTRTYAEDRPPLESVLYAQAILWASIAGAPDEDATTQKKSASPVTEAPRSRGRKAASEKSTQPVAQ